MRRRRLVRDGRVVVGRSIAPEDAGLEECCLFSKQVCALFGKRGWLLLSTERYKGVEGCREVGVMLLVKRGTDLLKDEGKFQEFMCDLGSGSEEAWSCSPAAATASRERGATAICTDQGCQGRGGAYILVTPDSENPLPMSVVDYYAVPR